MDDRALPALATLADDLEAGRTSARALTEECLARLDDPAGQGQVAFLQVNHGAALAAADAMDALRRVGAQPSRFAGIPISIKDLFDVRGQVTKAGSRVLSGRAAATRDALAVARLRAAGFVLIGRTNMTEFAYSGLGLNPHYGTPLSPWRRHAGHISGGSTSGGAVSVSDGMAHAALGTDTGGSCRIPAAWCGLVGFKPTARRIPRDGTIPLSGTLDSVGPIARSVECCAVLDAMLAGENPAPLHSPGLPGMRLGVVDNVVMDGIVPEVAIAFSDALERLSAAGARLMPARIAAFDQIAPLSAKGGFPAAEAYAWHRSLLAEHEELYDPRVSVRIKRGLEQDAADYVQLATARAALVAQARMELAPFDALVMPTTPILPPRLADMLAQDSLYGQANLLALRNPTLINMIDGCAVSLPIAGPDGAPCGLMLAGRAGTDHKLLALAHAIEGALRG